MLYRNVKSIDFNQLNACLVNTLSELENQLIHQDFNCSINTFISCLRIVLDEFAPIKIKRIKENSRHLPVKWIDTEYFTERTKRRKLEWSWKTHCTTASKAAYLSQMNLCAHMAKRKMSAALSTDRDKVSDLFKLVYKVLDRDISRTTR